MPMHDSTRDQLLDLMVGNGWANSSDGDVEAPTGHFAVVVNPAEDLLEIEQAFGDEISVDIPEGYDWNEVAGNFIVRKNSDGMLDVHSHAAPGAAWNTYRLLQEQYQVWAQQ